MKITRRQLKRLIRESFINEGEPISIFLLTFASDAILATIVTYIAATNYKFARSTMTVSDVKDIFSDIDADKLQLALEKIPVIIEHANRCQDENLLAEIKYFIDTGKKIIKVFDSNAEFELSEIETTLLSAEAYLAGKITLQQYLRGLTTVSSSLSRIFRKIGYGAQAISLGAEAAMIEDQLIDFENINFARIKDTINGFDRLYTQINSEAGLEC
jgi:hypothetical protein